MDSRGRSPRSAVTTLLLWRGIPWKSGGCLGSRARGWEARCSPGERLAALRLSHGVRRAEREGVRELFWPYDGCRWR